MILAWKRSLPRRVERVVMFLLGSLCKHLKTIRHKILPESTQNLVWLRRLSRDIQGRQILHIPDTFRKHGSENSSSQSSRIETRRTYNLMLLRLVQTIRRRHFTAQQRRMNSLHAEGPPRRLRLFFHIPPITCSRLPDTLAKRSPCASQTRPPAPRNASGSWTISRPMVLY